jgi:hypothetical protein
MFVTESGITMDDNDLQCVKEFNICVTELGIEIDVSEEHLLKAPRMFLIEFGM